MPASPPLIGRSAELEELCSALDEASNGNLRTVIIEGEAGIGKTRLTNELVGMADERGFPVLLAPADEVDRSRPFGPLLNALSGYGLGADAASEYAQREEIVAAIEEVVTNGPAALVIDDAQWADAATVSTLVPLARRLEGSPLLLVVTARPLPRAPELVTALRYLDGARVVLGPLDDADAMTLAGDVDAELVRRAGGNPFFILELARATDRGEVSRTVFDSLDYLGADTLALVQIASVLGSTFDLTDVAAVTGRPAAQLLPQLTEAMTAGVLGEREDRLAFRHDLVRQAAYEAVPLAARAVLHRDAARALASAGAPPGRVAAQFALAAERDDTEAIDWLRRAAAESMSTPAAAAGWLEHALALTRGDAAARAEIAHDLAFALEAGGRLAEAERVCRDALAEGPDPAAAAALRVRLIHSLVFQGRGHDILSEAEAARSRPHSDAEGALIDAYAAMALVFVGDMPGASAAAGEVIRRRSNVADAGACFAEITLAVAQRLHGRFADAVAHAERAVEIAAVERRAAPRFDPEHFRAQCLVSTARFDDAATSIANGRRNAERLGLAWNLPGYHYLAAMRLFYLGEWDDSLTEVVTGLELDADVGSPDLPSMLAFHAQLLVHLGDLERAERALHEADATWARTGSSLGSEMGAAARAELRDARGDSDAFAELDALWSFMQSVGSAGELQDSAAALVRAALARGDVDRARTIAADLTSLATGSGSPIYEAAAMHCNALVAGASSDAIAAAAAAYGALRMPVYEARANEDAGGMLAGTDVEAARAHYEHALATYERVGAVNHAARVTAALRAIGVRRGSRAKRARATSGWESLTPTELAVVALITEGLTTAAVASRLYISPHTVTTHVKHIFNKLGMSSRVELAAAASRR